jgi:hypothetical protein
VEHVTAQQNQNCASTNPPDFAHLTKQQRVGTDAHEEQAKRKRKQPLTLSNHLAPSAWQ